MIAKRTNHTGEDWIAAHDYKDHTRQRQKGWDYVAAYAMHGYEGKADYPQDSKQRRSKPVHSVIDKSGSNRWLRWCAKKLYFHRRGNNGTEDREVSHGLGGKSHTHQLRRVDRYMFTLEGG